MSLFDSSNYYESYAYSYPHKLAYRQFKKPLSIKDVWQNENKSNMFLYIHIPYCEMRCGFCNLLTVANPKNNEDEYINTVLRELEAYKNEHPSIDFQEYAFGGGTPTFLKAESLDKLFWEINKITGNKLVEIIGSIEASPKTINSEKLKILSQNKVTRLSMGIQSWIQDETKSLGRGQSSQIVEHAIIKIKDIEIPVLNLDLIYGIKNQTTKSFIYSLEKTLSFEPEEIFLYPLYIRDLTGLGKKNQRYKDNKLKLYQFGRDYLLNNGYNQISMRCFRKPSVTINKSTYNPTIHNTIGLGAGARSYTSSLNYSTQFAVNRNKVLSIVNEYTKQSNKNLHEIQYGIKLNKIEQKIRFILKSLIDGSSLNPTDYHNRFSSNPFDEFALLQKLVEHKMLEEKSGHWKLSTKGMENEDLIGPAFYSNNIKNKIKVEIV